MDAAMYTKDSTQSHHEPAVALIAQESRVSVDEVTRLYGMELAKLEVGARIRGFLPIFAIRNVRKMLRQRSAGNEHLPRTRGAWNG